MVFLSFSDLSWLFIYVCFEDFLNLHYSETPLEQGKTSSKPKAAEPCSPLFTKLPLSRPDIPPQCFGLLLVGANIKSKPKTYSKSRMMGLRGFPKSQNPLANPKTPLMNRA